MIIYNTNNITKNYNYKYNNKTYRIKLKLLISFCLSLIISIVCIKAVSYNVSNRHEANINCMDFYGLKKVGYKSVFIVNGDRVDSLIDNYFSVNNIKVNNDIRTALRNEIIQLNNLDKYATIYAGGHLLFPIYE